MQMNFYQSKVEHTRLTDEIRTDIIQVNLHLTLSKGSFALGDNDVFYFCRHEYLHRK